MFDSNFTLWQQHRLSGSMSAAACNRAAAAGQLLLLLLLCISLPQAACHRGNKTEDYSCEAISKVPPEERCSFFRSSCQSESLVPYAEWYYCHVGQSNVVLRWLYVAAVCCLVPLAFCLLGDTAEFYIAPIMAHVSQAVPKMRPRFAGVTFVALGNGAPDLSANIAAISAGEVTLSAGALTGAAMFVQCIVAAELVALAGPGGIKCGGAMLRDVGVYCLAILSVLLAFYIGQISHFFVGWALMLYVVYMIWVFAGDEWHQRGRPRLNVQSSFKALLGRSRDALQHPRQSWAGLDGPRVSGSRTTSSSGLQRFSNGLGYSTRDELEESLLPWAVAEEEPDQFYRPVDHQHQAVQPSAGDRLAALRIGSGTDTGGRRSSTPSGVVVGSVLSMQYSTELSAFGAVQFSRRGSTASDSHGDSIQGSSPVNESSMPYSLGAAQAPLQLPNGQPGVLQPSGFGFQAPSGRRTASSSLWGGASAAGSLPGGGLAVQRSHSQQPHLVSMGRQSYLDPKTYKQLVWADLADDEEEEARLEREIARQLLSRRGHGSFGGIAGSYQPPVAAAVMERFSSVPTTPYSHQQQLPVFRQVASVPGEQAEPLGKLAAAGPAAATAATSASQMESGLLLSPFGPAALRTAPSTPPSAAADEMAELEVSPTSRRRALAAGLPIAEVLFEQLGNAEPPSLGPLHGAGNLGQQQQQDQQQQVLQQGPVVDRWKHLQWELTLGNSEEWEDAGAVRKLFRKVTFPLLLPAYLGQRLTIPFASSAGYSREWLISSLLCCPLALILYLGLLTLPAVLVACGCGITAAAAAGVLTWWDGPGEMPVQGLGGVAAAAVPGVLAVLAFCMGVVWIDTIATEVVGVITFLGGLASLPAGVMGLTLLAWGNSLGDYFGNRAMAKAGHGSTAITACFAAPLFNMLISLSLGFSSLLHKLGAGAVSVQLTPEVTLGCLFLMGFNIVIICVGRLCGNRLPPWFAYFARAWYALYFGLSVFSGFYSSSSAAAAQS